MAVRNTDMRKIASLLAIIVFLIAGWSLWFVTKHEAVSSQMCSTTLEDNIRSADVIMTGQVFAVLPGGALGAKVIMTPLTVYRGNLDAPTATIEARADSGEDEVPVNGHELHFASGQSAYLLFLHRTEDGVYRTSECQGSRFLGAGLTDAEQSLLIGTSSH